jgi:hypothetical protein
VFKRQTATPVTHDSSPVANYERITEPTKSYSFYMSQSQHPPYFLPQWLRVMLNKCSLSPFFLCLSAFLVFFAPTPAHSENRIITADATYIMGDGETPALAEAMVLQKAKQAALEEAGTYVQSYTKATNLDITVEEIQTIAGGLLRTEVLKKTRTLVGDGVRFDIAIKATIEVEKMEQLAKRIKGKNVTEEYAKLQTEYAQLSRDFESLKQSLLKFPSGPERDTTLERLRDREKSYRSLQKKEGQFFEHLISGSTLYDQALAQLYDKQTEKNRVDVIFDKLLREGYAIALGAPKIGATSRDARTVTLTVPISISINETVRTEIIETAAALGGPVGEHIQVVNDRSYRSDKPSTPGVLLRMGKHYETQKHFQRRVENQRLVLQARSQAGVLSWCYLPTIDYRSVYGTGFGLNLVKKDYKKYRVVGERGYFREPEYTMISDREQVASFVVSMFMSLEAARELTSVAAQIDDGTPSRDLAEKYADDKEPYCF